LNNAHEKIIAIKNELNELLNHLTGRVIGGGLIHYLDRIERELKEQLSTEQIELVKNTRLVVSAMATLIQGNLNKTINDIDSFCLKMLNANAMNRNNDVKKLRELSNTLKVLNLRRDESLLYYSNELRNHWRRYRRIFKKIESDKPWT